MMVSALTIEDIHCFKVSFFQNLKLLPSFSLYTRYPIVARASKGILHTKLQPDITQPTPAVLRLQKTVIKLEADKIEDID